MLIAVKTRNSAADTIPMPIVDQVGVKNRGWIREKWLGIALCTAIERVVRAVGRMVVWVDAAALVRIVAANSTCSTDPTPEFPNTAGAIAEKTSSAVFGLPRPMPCVSMPAN